MRNQWLIPVLAMMGVAAILLISSSLSEANERAVDTVRVDQRNRRDDFQHISKELEELSEQVSKHRSESAAFKEKMKNELRSIRHRLDQIESSKGIDSTANGDAKGKKKRNPLITFGVIIGALSSLSAWGKVFGWREKKLAR